MRGNIEARGTNTWRITVALGSAPDGKRLRHRETVHGFKRDAERRLREVLQSVEAGLYIAPSKMTTGEYLERWVSSYAAVHSSPRTAQSYQDELRRHIIPALGNIPLTELRPHHIEEYQVRALSSGRTDGRGGLSPRTVAYHHAILSEALEQAVRQDELARNPAKLVDPPRPARPELSTLTVDSVPRLLSAAAQSEYHQVLLTAIFTGARVGELLALQWRNVDLDNATMTIVATLYRMAGAWHLKEPKSARSRRQVALPTAVVAELREHKLRLEAERAALGTVVAPTDFVFCRVGGEPLHGRSVKRALDKALEDSGLQHVRVHDLRHTHASLLVQAGANPKVISERLGHGSVAFTLDTYSHIMPGMQQSAVSAFEALVKTSREVSPKCPQALPE